MPENDNDKRFQLPHFTYKDLVDENPNLEKSFINQEAKKKKIKASRTKVAALGLAAVIGIGGLAEIGKKIGNKIFERSHRIEDAHEYADETIMPQILEITDCKAKDGEEGYAFDNSKDEYKVVTSALSEALNISSDTASYILFEYCDYNDELFNNLGYTDASDWAKKHDYIVKDSWDASSLDVFKNMNEEAFLDAISSYKKASDELNTDNIYDVKTYLDLNKNEDRGSR